jgi:hypothetical protein
VSLDLSQFKRLKSDDKHTVLSHPSGRQMKIAHHGLSNYMKEQIEALPMLGAEGGKVPSNVHPDNALQNFIPKSGIVGGTIKDGSEDEKFIFHNLCFDVQKARDISKKKANAEIPVSPKWIDKIKVDPEAAMESDSKNPVFIAQVHSSHGLKPLLIDGNHRMYKAVQKGKNSIDAYIFSPEQTKDLMVNMPKNASQKLEHRDDQGEDVQMFAKGGKVYSKYARKFDPNQGAKASKPSKASNTMPGSQPEMAKDTYTEPDEQGGNDVVLKALNRQAPPFGVMGTERQHYPPCINPSCKSFGKSHPNCRCYGGGAPEAGMFAKGGEVDKEYYCDSNRAHFKNCEYYKDGGNVQKFADKGEVESDDSSQDSDQSPSDDQASQQDQMQNASSTVAAPNPSTEIPQTGVPQQEPAAPDQPLQPADPYAQYQQKLFDVNQFMHDQSQKFYSDVDQGHIQPKTMNQLFHDKNLPGKIGTIFGLIVAGAGAGLTHQDNSLLTLMQKQIDNDLQAQERNQANRQNLMSINGQNLMRMVDAGQIGMNIRQMQIEQSRDQANYYLYNQLAQQAANITNPQQATKAAQTLALLKPAMEADKASAFAKAAGANALGQMLQTSGTGNAGTGVLMKSGLAGPEAARAREDIESKTVPGYGMATMPVPKDTRDTLANLDRFDTSLDHLKSLIGQHAGTVDWTKYPEADTAAREAQQAYTAVRGSVPSYAGDEQLNKIITGGKNPLNIISYLKGNPGRIDEIKKANSIQRNSITTMAGLPTKKTPSTSQSQPKIKVVNGVRYKRGPNGEAIRID